MSINKETNGLFFVQNQNNQLIGFNIGRISLIIGSGKKIITIHSCNAQPPQEEILSLFHDEKLTELYGKFKPIRLTRYFEKGYWEMDLIESK